MNRRHLANDLPTLLTLGNLLSGFAAIVFATDGRPLPAAALIFVSALLDTLDGHAARSLGVASRRGAVLDSLADVVAFGVAPALLLVALSAPANLLHWAAAVWLVCAAALRLARFTADAESPSGALESAGLPCPASAMTIAAVGIALGWAERHAAPGDEPALAAWSHVLLPVAAAALGALMVSRVAYPRPHEWLLHGARGVRSLVVVATCLLAVLAAGGYAPLVACGLFVLTPLLLAPVRVLARGRRSAEG